MHSRSTRRSKRNFVKENSKSQVRKHSHQEFSPGTFITHHPSRCYHTLNSHPIHLKRENPTNGKTFVRILTQDSIRDLLVPSTSNLYPAVWHASEMERIKIKSLRLTNDEKQTISKDIERMNNQLKNASEKRKTLILKWNEIE